MMDQEKAFRLLNRQLKDIHANAERIINGCDSPEEIESFARYSIELKGYINERIENEEFKRATNEIPDINYRRTQIQLWQYLILPSWWFSIYMDYQVRKKIKEEISLVKAKYESLHILSQNQME